MFDVLTFEIKCFKSFYKIMNRADSIFRWYVVQYQWIVKFSFQIDLRIYHVYIGLNSIYFIFTYTYNSVWQYIQRIWKQAYIYCDKLLQGSPIQVLTPQTVD